MAQARVSAGGPLAWPGASGVLPGGGIPVGVLQAPTRAGTLSCVVRAHRMSIIVPAGLKLAGQYRRTPRNTARQCERSRQASHQVPRLLVGAAQSTDQAVRISA